MEIVNRTNIPLIRLAEENDEEDILFLLNSVFKEQQRSDKIRSDSYWQWKFKSSPFGKSILTVAEIDNKIVGVDNLWPWEFIISGNIYRAFQPCDLVVHPKVRGLGLSRKMRLYGLSVAREFHPSFVFNFPNYQSIKTNLSLGWYNMGKIPWMVKLIKPVPVLKGLLKPGKAQPLVLDRTYNIDIEFLENIEEEYASYDAHIKPHRKKGYFAWRYLQHPFRYYGMIRSMESTNTSAAIFTINQLNAFREMFIVDIIGNSRQTYELIRIALDKAREMDISILSLMYNGSHRMNHLWCLGFVKIRIKNMVVLPIDPKLETMLRSYNNWSMFACIHDSI